MNAYDILKERGFIEQVTNESKIRELLSKEGVVFYVGFDPSAPSLHVGNLEQLMAIMHLQQQGHQPIVLIGGGTGLIGDPSDKDKGRPLHSLSKIKQNAAALEKQVKKILDLDKMIFLNNADWLKKLNYIEFLRDIGRHFSVNRLLAVEWIKKRLPAGLSFLEFNYQLLQAYDFWYLFHNYNCVLQLGGSDQWGNIVAGIELIRKNEEKEAYGITLPLLTTRSGKKMGKTEKGAVWLSPELTSPYEYYQFWINTDDRDVKKFLSLFTFLSLEEIKSYAKLRGEKIASAKEALAFEATKIAHGQIEAEKARVASRSLFGKQKSASELIPTVLIKRSEIQNGIPVPKLFIMAGLCSSNSEASRLIKQGGAYLNETPIRRLDLLVTDRDFQNNELLLKSGKKKFKRLKIV